MPVLRREVGSGRGTGLSTGPFLTEPLPELKLGPPVFTSANPGIPASSPLACRPPSRCTRLSRARSTAGPPSRLRPSIGNGPARHPDRLPGREGQPPAVPTFTAYRSASQAPSCTPAASPTATPQTSPRPPRRLPNLATELTPLAHKGHALHTGPYPPDLSRHDSYGASATDSLALNLLALIAGPGPSGSTKPSRLCRAAPALPGVPRIRLPPSSIRPLRRPDGEGLSPPLGNTAPRGAAASSRTGALRSAWSFQRAALSSPGGDRRPARNRLRSRRSWRPRSRAGS
jgi:hypothetical protein